MSLVTTALVGVAALVILMFMGLPIPFAMLLVGGAGICYLTSFKALINLISTDFWSQFSSYGMLTIPLFTLMGTLASQTGIAGKLYLACDKFLGHMRGGLALATTVTCALFGAMCGSTTAEVAIMAKVARPEMQKYRYDDTLSCGSIAASANLAILIPPSSTLIVFGIMTGDSILKLFAGGMMPGIILTLLFCLTISIITKRNPNMAPATKRSTGKEKLKALGGCIDFVLMVAFCIGGLLAGWFTPTEAGAAGSAAAIVISLYRKQFSWKKFMSAVAEATKSTGNIFLLVTSALIFGHFMALTQVPNTLSAWIGSLNVAPQLVLIFIIIFYLLGGMIMDALPLFMLTIPVLYPIITSLGYSGLWFGIIIVLITEMGFISPPVGVGVFVMGSVTPDVPLYRIFKGAMWFMPAIVILALLLIFVPQLVTFLPGLLQ